MPSCSDCRMLVGSQCSAYTQALETLGRELPPAPLGACMIPIVEDYLPMIKAGMSVLEVGCGSWDRIQRHCQSVGAHYEGIDTRTEYFGKKTIATRIENLAQLSFPDTSFDLVIGTQTMEHWAEYGCSITWGLYQCFRVCKRDGMVLLNVPIHYHGTWQFMQGDIEALRHLFAPFSSRVSYQSWASPSDPLPALFPFPGYWGLTDKPAYILDIAAVKDRDTPRIRSPRHAHTGRLAQAWQYPLSFNVYRVLRKMRLFREGV